MLTWIQKALPQFKDFEGEALNYVENWILCKSAEWLPDLTILLKQVCEWYDFVFLENLTSRAWVCLFRSEFMKWHLFMFIQLCFQNLSLNQAQVLALIRLMKDNITLSSKLFDSGYNIIW